jgi:hypothetical protein
MALTWREVSAPDFSGVALSQRNAALALRDATGGLSDALGAFSAGKKDAVSSQVAIDALKFTDPAAYQEALRSGSLLAGRDASQITPEAIDFLAGRARSLQGNQAADLSNIGKITDNAQGTLSLTQNVNAYGRNQQELAIADAGKALYGKIFSDGASSPADVENRIRTSGASAEVQAAALAQAAGNSSTLFGPPGTSTHASNIAALMAGRIIGAESSGDPNAKNPLSSASGLGGFTNGTWLDTIKKHRPDIKGTDQELLALKSNGDLSTELTTKFTEDNIGVLQKASIPVTPGNIYLAHFAGQGGVQDIFKASDDAQLDTVLGKEEMAANPILAGKNVAWIKQWAADEMVRRGGQQAAAPADPAALLAQAAGGGSSAAAATSVVGGGQTALDQITLDETYRGNEAVLGKLVDRPDRGKSKVDVVKSLLASVGPDAGITEPVLTQELDKVLAANPGMAPDVAATLIENSVRAYPSRWSGGFGKNGIFNLNGPQLIADAVRLVAPGAFDADTRFVDQDEVSRQIGEFIEPGTKEPTKRGVAQVAGVRLQQQAKAQIAELSGLVEQAKAEFNNAQIRAAGQGDPRIMQEAQRKLETTTAYANQQIQLIESSLATRLNTLPLTKDDKKKK